jgi:hypothetical protein
MKKAVYGVTAMAVVSCLALAGCKQAVEKAVEQKLAKEGINAKVDSSGGQVTIQTKDGTAVISGGKGATVPENFPKDVYVYEGATITASVAVPNGFNLAMETGDSAEKVLAAIKGKMTGFGWKEEMNMNQGKNSIVSFKKGERGAMVNISEGPKTHINLTATEHK